MSVEEILVPEIIPDKREQSPYKSIVHESTQPEINLVETNEKIVAELKARLIEAPSRDVNIYEVSTYDELYHEASVDSVTSIQGLTEPMIQEPLRLGQQFEESLSIGVQKNETLSINTITEDVTTSELVELNQVSTESENAEFSLSTELDTDLTIELQVQSYEGEIILLNNDIAPALEDTDIPFEPESDVLTPEREVLETEISPDILELRAEILEAAAEQTLATELGDTVYDMSDENTNSAVVEFIANVGARVEAVSALDFQDVQIEEVKPAYTIEKFARYLHQDVKEAEPHISEIITTLCDLRELLPDADADITVSELFNEVVVQKLVELFAELGYEKPLHAVKLFFEDKGITEGVSILRYVANLARGFDAQEGSPITRYVKDDISAAVHALGSVLLRLTAKKILESPA